MTKSYVALFVLVITMVTGVKSNALDDYVNTPDPHYNYRYLTTYNAPGVTVHVLNLTSQKWLSDDVTTNPIWFHHLFIVIPVSVVHKDTASIQIGSGWNTDLLATLSDDAVNRAVLIAQTTGAVSAVINQVPNQPIVFQDDPERRNRSEDAIVSWTWKKFLHNTSDPNILLLLPMTKAAVRGMDAVSSYVSSLTGNVINKFMVSGRSKRGWTTWLTAAVDKRVIAMAPTVFDLLNMNQNLRHHLRSLGGWSFALSDYYQLNLTYDLDNPGLRLFQDLVDPIVYNDRYSIPKLIITSAGDEFFLLDDSHYFYDQLQSPKHIRTFPNVGHAVADTEIGYSHTLGDFFLNVLEKAQIPNVTWVLSQTGYGGKITARTSQIPTNVTVFYAVTADDKRRDFRHTVWDPVKNRPRLSSVVWLSQNVTRISDLEYEADLKRPATGWLAFFIQLTFPGIHNSTHVFTTQVNIIPDIFSFQECSGTTCYGTIV